MDSTSKHESFIDYTARLLADFQWKLEVKHAEEVNELTSKIRALEAQSVVLPSSGCARQRGTSRLESIPTDRETSVACHRRMLTDVSHRAEIPDPPRRNSFVLARGDSKVGRLFTRLETKASVFTLSPYSQIIEFWSLFMFVNVAVYSVLWFAFLGVSEWSHTRSATGQYFQFVYVLDLMVPFFTAIEIERAGRTILISKHRLVAIHHLKGWFLIDLAGVFPFEVLFDDEESIGMLKTVKIMRLFKLVKFGRYMVTVKRYIDTLEEFLGNWTGEHEDLIHLAEGYLKRIFALTLFVFLELHLASSLLLFLAQSSDCTIAGVKPQEMAPFQRYWLALEFVSHLMTSGIPHSNNQADSCGSQNRIAFMFTIVFYLQAPIIMSAFVGLKSHTLEVVRTRQQLLKRFLAEKGVGWGLRHDVAVSVWKAARHTHSDVDSIMQGLPKDLTLEVKKGIFSGMIHDFALFQQASLDGNSLEYKLCRIGEIRYFEADEGLISRGSTLHGMYYMVHGVALSTSSLHERKVHEKEYFAMEALFAPPFSSSSHTIQSMAPCETWLLPRYAFDKVVADDELFRLYVDLVRSKVHFDQRVAEWVLDDSDIDEVVTLKVMIISARNLICADIGCMQSGMSDPYCVLTIRENEVDAEKKTKTVENTADPVWQQEFYVDDYTPGDSLDFHVLDDDFGYNEDDSLGRAKLQSDAFYPSGFEGELPLSTKGHLNVQIIPYVRCHDLGYLHRVGLTPSMSTWVQKTVAGSEDETEAMKSQRLGVSLQYLTEHFEADLLECGFQDLENTTFYELKDSFWNPEDYLGFKGSKDKVCPRDNLPGCSIVDAVEDRFKGKATHYLSWCWGYTVARVISALRQWLRERKLDGTQTFMWICFFCNNQRKIILTDEGAASSTGQLEDIFEDRLKAVRENSGHMVALLDKYDDPIYAHRIWCIYEIFKGFRMNMEIEIIFPREVKERFMDEIKHGHLNMVATNLLTIHVEKATATNIEDETQIKHSISQTVGFDVLNSVVRDRLRQSLSYVLKDVLEREEIPEEADQIFSMFCTDMWSSDSCFREGILDPLGCSRVGEIKEGTVSHSFSDQAEMSVSRLDFCRSVAKHQWLLKFLRLSNLSPEAAFESIVRYHAGLTRKNLAEHLQSEYGGQRQIRHHLAEIIHDNADSWNDPALEFLRSRLYKAMNDRSSELEALRRQASRDKSGFELLSETSGLPRV